jgi:hypothetical protein
MTKFAIGATTILVGGENMADREKVIKAWEIFRDSNPYEICSGREFRAIREPEYCMGQMIEDTIALLKEQEAFVRCKDCKHNARCEIAFGCNGNREWFCADGERAE